MVSTPNIQAALNLSTPLPHPADTDAYQRIPYHIGGKGDVVIAEPVDGGPRYEHVYLGGWQWREIRRA